MPQSGHRTSRLSNIDDSDKQFYRRIHTYAAFTWFVSKLRPYSYSQNDSGNILNSIDCEE